MKKLRLTVLTIIFALIVSGVPVSSVFAKESANETVNMAGRVKDGKIVITEIEITDLDKPVAGTLLDNTAKIVSLSNGKPDGISWKIPVVWVDAAGNRVTVGLESVRCYPVFIFYVPDGYILNGVDFQKGINIRFPAFVSSLYGSSSGMISVSDPMLGISYITGIVTDIKSSEASEYSGETDTDNDYSSLFFDYIRSICLNNNEEVVQDHSDAIDEHNESQEQKKEPGKEETESEEGKESGSITNFM